MSSVVAFSTASATCLVVAQWPRYRSFVNFQGYRRCCCCFYYYEKVVSVTCSNQHYRLQTGEQRRAYQIGGSAADAPAETGQRCLESCGRGCRHLTGGRGRAITVTMSSGECTETQADDLQRPPRFPSHQDQPRSERIRCCLTFARQMSENGGGMASLSEANSASVYEAYPASTLAEGAVVHRSLALQRPTARKTPPQAPFQTPTVFARCLVE